MYSGTISISSHRALERTLDAAALLADDREIVFAVVGEGLKKDALRAKAAALGLANAVFLPFVPYAELPDLLASSDVLLVPLDGANSDLSVPSKLYSAMAAGRPVLGLAEPGSEVALLLCDNDCGLTAPPDDAAAVAWAVRGLKASPERRRALGASARAFAVRRFSKDEILSRYDGLLKSMVS